jgi:hypothetical protein
VRNDSNAHTTAQRTTSCALCSSCLHFTSANRVQSSIRSFDSDCINTCSICTTNSSTSTKSSTHHNEWK